ncbi:MAG: hypothetical protein CSA58_09975 [Micrococcales bacterium]|nr:MAG: hypothetical protein CSA58_09975 [Micrococcales bacterium]
MELMVTRRTITDGTYVYPMDGLCSFGPAKKAAWVPWPIIAVLFFIAPIASVATYFAFNQIGLSGLDAFLAFVVFVSPLVAVFVNTAGPAKPGLLIGFASGEKRFFPSTDAGGIQGVTQAVGRILDGVEENGLRVDARADKVGGHLVIGGSSQGDVSSGW